MPPEYERDDGLQSWLDRVANHPLLTGAEERDLARRWKAGDERARQRLEECNLRLVLSIAQRWKGRGLELADLVQAGCIGLNLAARKFDADRGVRFSTYATWWVTKTIQQALERGGPLIHVPGVVRQRRARAREALVDDPGMLPADVAKLLETEPEQIRRALDAAVVVTSLDRTGSVDDESTRSLGEDYADPLAADPSDLVASSSHLHDALKELTDIQRRVLGLRFGFDGGDALKFEEIAAELNLTVSAVQSAQRSGLARLRELVPAVD